MALVDLVQKSKNWSSLPNQKGQALVEYVLMLVVSVAMVLALGYQVFKPFQSFLKAYMGDYIACLLDTGELPSLGNRDAKEALSEEGCNVNFEAATLAGGRPPKSSSGSSRNSSSTSSSKSSDSKSSSGDSSGGGGNPSPRSSSSRNLLVSSNNARNGTESKASSDKVTEIPIEGRAGGGLYNRRDSWSESGSRNVASRTTALGMAGLTEDEKKKLNRQDGAKKGVVSGENFAPPPKKIVIPKNEPKVATAGEDEPMTFGNFFRFLLIAAIIIALIVVLGSQALKISKSQEK